MGDPFHETLEEYRAALDAQVKTAAVEEMLDEARKKLLAQARKDRGDMSIDDATASMQVSDEYEQATDRLLLAREALAAAKAKVKWLEKRFAVWEERSRSARAKRWRERHGNAQTQEGPEYGQADGRC